MRLVFLGPPGAGKGTQAARLAEHFKILHIATGDMLRRAVDNRTPLGRLIKERLEEGELVPDKITDRLVAETISEKAAEKGFALDGYPRTASQAVALDGALDQHGAKLDRVIRFMVTGPEIIERLSGRRVCPVCEAVYHIVTHPPKVKWVCDRDQAELVQREDDRPEAIARRLEVYGRRTKPLIDLYKERGIMSSIDAIGTEDEVFERVLAGVGGSRGGR